MKLEFLPEAGVEFEEAVLHYEGLEKDLGKRLRDEVREICSTILSHPLLWRERSGGFRRVNCPVFPYYIAYVIREDFLVVVAVAHGSREPGFWHDRLK